MSAEQNFAQAFTGQKTGLVRSSLTSSSFWRRSRSNSAAGKAASRANSFISLSAVQRDR